MTAPKLIGLYSPAPQSGKSTVAGILTAHHDYRIVSFAEPLKEMIEGLLRRFGYSAAKVEEFATYRKEDTIPSLGKSYRELCQTLGTEWGRKCVVDDLWVRAAMSRVGPDRVVIDDVRFPNEAEAILKRGGQVWKIVRPGAEVVHRHASDGGLEEFNFHRILHNAGSFRDLQNTLWDILHG